MNDKKLVVGIIFVSVLILTGGAYFLGKNDIGSSSKIAPSYIENKGNPKIEAKEISYDLGKMKVSDEKYHDFLISNKGSGSLFLSGIKSSCMCTAGQVIYKGRESDEFGMHAQGSFPEKFCREQML